MRYRCPVHGELPLTDCCHAHVCGACGRVVEEIDRREECRREMRADVVVHILSRAAYWDRLADSVKGARGVVGELEESWRMKARVLRTEARTIERGEMRKGGE